MKKLAGIGLLALAAAPSLVSAQLPPIRKIGAVTATTTESFGANVFVRSLPSGVLVNDPLNRRLLLFNDKLDAFTVVADTTPATANAYSGRSAGLIAYRGDSSLFVDAQSMSMLVIDGTGNVARVMALPRAQDAMVLGTAIGNAAFDANGKLVYRGMNFGFGRPGGGERPNGERGAQRGDANRGDANRGDANRGQRPAERPSGGIPGPGGMMIPEPPDTAPIVRVDLATRVVDTIVWTKIPRPKIDVQRDEGTGRVSVNMIMNPLPTVDDWAVLSDGSIAIVRGRDYHLDFVRSDGKMESAAKIPYEWERMTDDDKVAFIDSLKAARARLLASQPQPATSGSATTGGGGGAGPGGGGQVIIMGGGGGGGGMNREPQFVQPQELPDYKPPFFAGQMRADMDGNLWVRTTKGVAGGPVYDVINSKGELVDRVQVPTGRSILGFGKGGVVYLAAADGDKRHIERVSVK